MSLPSEDVAVLLDGSKTFWKTRSYLKIIIVSHPKQNSIEVIAYDPSDGIEFPRIYLNSSLVATKLDDAIVEKTYTTKKEALNRSKISKNRDDLLLEIRTQMMMQYAYARVNLSALDEKLGAMQFCLQPSFDDLLVRDENDTMKIDVERVKPDDLSPYEVITTIVKS